MRKRTAALILLAGLAMGGAAEARPATPAVQEDSPAWDCRSMGNKVCGYPLDLTQNQIGALAKQIIAHKADAAEVQADAECIVGMTEQTPVAPECWAPVK